MKNQLNILAKISLGSLVALTFVLVTWLSMTAKAADKKHDSHRSMYMHHITTLAQAKALKSGDSLAVVCSMCKYVVVHTVTDDNSHVQMMAIGHKYVCGDCKGVVQVVGTGQGKGNNEQVNHVCSKCGDSAMFVCATKPGSGSKDNH